MLDEFNNVWIDKTIPSTELQCIRYVCFKNWTNAMQKGIVKIVTIDQYAQMSKAAAAWTGPFPHFQTQKIKGLNAPDSTPTTLRMRRYERLRIYL